MAYMSQENKKSKAPAIKAILKKYNLKGSLSVRNSSTLVLTIASGALDFIRNYNEKKYDGCFMSNGFNPISKDGYIDVNPYHYQNHFSGKAVDCLREIFTAMNVGNHDRSDPYSDYSDIGWYCDVNIGQWDKSYIFTDDHLPRFVDHICNQQESI